MSIYLQDIPLAEAIQRLEDHLKEAGLWRVLGTEEIPLDENAVGRILAEPVWARRSSPHYHASAMDGFAVIADDTNGAMPTNPVTIHLGNRAIYVDTGDPLPFWTNAVIPIENIEPMDVEGRPVDNPRKPHAIRFRAAVSPWSNVRPVGEDIVASQLVLPSGHKLRPADLGAAAASGAEMVVVARRPHVAILPTGTELVPISVDPREGEITEFNSIMLASQVIEWGGVTERFSITKDDFSLIQDSVQQAADRSDLVLLNAGSSAGAEDFSAKVIESLGEVFVHGIAVRPGHPVILGMVRRSNKEPTEWVPVIGIPGYPVSAALTGEIFIAPLLARWLGHEMTPKQEIMATLTRKIVSPAGDDDYVRVVVGRVGDRLLASPLARGAGVITSLARSDGLLVIPRGTQGLESGSPVNIRLSCSPEDLERTIFVIGSHDMTLDILAQELSSRSRRLVSSNVGSQGGLVAIRRGEAHLAGCHLMDPDTGQYNTTAVRQYLSDEPVKIIVWAGRVQGLIVPKGNPKHITSLTDLTRSDVSLMNRQRGAGTRVLLDYHLAKLNINPEDVHGYEQEEYTHLAVAAAVASGRADCALGITAAALSLDLDFIPLFQERYDLIIPLENYGSELLAPVLELMNDPVFKGKVSAMPGYDVSFMGKEIEQEV